MNFEIREIQKKDKLKISTLLEKYWGSVNIIVKGNIYDASMLSGFIAYEKENNEILGFLTYIIENDKILLITLNSLKKGLGCGSALINKIEEYALFNNLKKIFLVVTNDNMSAIKFYQRIGFKLYALHKNSIVEARKLKPEIPILGLNSIPIRDEIELEFTLQNDKTNEYI